MALSFVEQFNGNTNRHLCSEGVWSDTVRNVNDCSADLRTRAMILIKSCEVDLSREEAGTNNEVD